ncbi:hypothetical protein HYQ45_004987 [Verticillium longisporum]|nr:hypothetical protein VdG2_04297 [Verticillium dahliae VDG2]KAG7122198.1 hypothetical protein HYQ44_003096 [Verticillium longisporum]PNH32104.1 hypothetical protein BJF96_g4475 [Verticillium dahliae]KAG7137793.1 hypothetical protein HYQ45_004987 [Verticillium longisporum]KAG7151542.1 hypothetical protein HYQ46_012673 [Verticillium longisporum]
MLTTLLFTVLPDTSSTLDRIETILSGTGSEISEYRQSLSSNMNMAAVAGAITAQVAITGLSLEARSQAHWTASAFLTASIAFGVISVYVSFIVQQELNGLLGSTGVADWLSVPLTQAELQEKANQLYQDPALVDTELSVPLEREVQPENGAARPGLTREASALAAILLSAPSGLLALSLNAFVIGLGIYLGCTYTDNLISELGKGGSLGVLVFYIVASATATFLYTFPQLVKSSEKYDDQVVTSLRRQIELLDSILRDRQSSDQRRQGV